MVSAAARFWPRHDVVTGGDLGRKIAGSSRKAAKQVAQDGSVVGSAGKPVQGNALLNARIAAQRGGDAGPTLNPLPDTGVVRPDTEPVIAVNPFPDRPRRDDE